MTFDLLLEERYVMACRRDHPLADRASVTWSEMYEHDYIALDKTSGNRLIMSQALKRLHPAKDSICETRHVTTAIGLVEAGLGVAAVPRSPCRVPLTRFSRPYRWRSHRCCATWA